MSETLAVAAVVGLSWSVCLYSNGLLDSQINGNLRQMMQLRSGTQNIFYLQRSQFRSISLHLEQYIQDQGFADPINKFRDIVDRNASKPREIGIEIGMFRVDIREAYMQLFRHVNGTSSSGSKRVGSRTRT